MKKTRKFNSTIKKVVFTSSLLLTSSVSTASSVFDISFNFDGYTASQQAVFNSAGAFWENIITGYQTGINGMSGIVVNAESKAIDGVGNVLGSAGPQFTTIRDGYTLTTQGRVSLDTADVSNMETNGRLLDVIKHELGHIIGFGTLWTQNAVYITDSGEYTGAQALATYQAEFDPLATFVPVELGGAEGTKNGHWDENNNGAGPTGIVDADGNDMRYELMTGWINTPIFISDTTKASFADIGYSVNLTAVPVPAAVWLFASALGMLGLVRRK